LVIEYHLVVRSLKLDTEQSPAGVQPSQMGPAFQDHCVQGEVIAWHDRDAHSKVINGAARDHLRFKKKRFAHQSLCHPEHVHATSAKHAKPTGLCTIRINVHRQWIELLSKIRDFTLGDFVWTVSPNSSYRQVLPIDGVLAAQRD
jgi:hypothetical protein